MNPLKVLLVVYAFPPAGGVGTLRAASLARYFPAEGIELDVLTTRNPSSVGMDYALLKEIPEEVRVHRTMTIDLPFGVKKWLKSLLTGRKKGGATAQAKAPAPGAANAAGHRPGLLKRILQDALLPDPQVTWLPILTRAARRIVRERKIDLVLITGAPYSDYLLAPRLRKTFPQLKIVLDFRDEWLATAFDVASFGFSTSERAKAFAMKAEADAVASADAVVAVTDAARREMRSRYPGDSDGKYLHIPNGFDATRLQPSAGKTSARADGKIVVTYVGTIYTSTEPTKFVEALHALPDEVKARYIFRFVGHVEDPGYRAALLSLGAMVELKGYMPQHEALQAMNDTDYVLLISHDRLNVSAKFYDYLGAGKPILACVHEDGDIRRMLEELRAGWWASSRDVEAMSRMFMDAVARGDSMAGSFNPDRAKIAEYERKPIAQRYAKALFAIAGREAGEDAR